MANMTIKLKDNTSFTVDEAKTRATSVIVKDSDLNTVKEAFTDDNLSHFEYIINGEVNGSYNDYKFVSVSSENDDEIVVSIRPKTDIEIRLDDVENAVADMSEVVYAE